MRHDERPPQAFLFLPLQVWHAGERHNGARNSSGTLRLRSRTSSPSPRRRHSIATAALVLSLMGGGCEDTTSLRGVRAAAILEAARCLDASKRFTIALPPSYHPVTSALAALFLALPFPLAVSPLRCLEAVSPAALSSIRLYRCLAAAFQHLSTPLPPVLSDFHHARRRRLLDAPSAPRRRGELCAEREVRR